MNEDELDKIRDRTHITEKAFDELYLSETEDQKGEKGGGACMMNAHRAAEYLVKNGVDRESLQLLYIVSPTPAGGEEIKPNADALRKEESQKNPTWGYHAAIMHKDTKQVFDLSSDIGNWGDEFSFYVSNTFLNKENKYIRFLTTSVDTLDDIVSGERIELDEMLSRSKEDGGFYLSMSEAIESE